MADTIMAQAGWHWCAKCDGLWHPQSGGPGVCPAGGVHSEAGSGDYALFEKPSAAFNPTIMAQSLWHWCAKCGSLWHAASSLPNNNTGVCPAGGGHSEAGSGDYALFNDSSGSIG